VEACTLATLYNKCLTRARQKIVYLLKLQPSFTATDVADAPLSYLTNRCNLRFLRWRAPTYRSGLRQRQYTFCICHTLVHYIVEVKGWLTNGHQDTLHLHVGLRHWWKCILQVTECVGGGKLFYLGSAGMGPYRQGIFMCGK